MTDQTQPRSTAPWIVAAVLALLTAALVVFLVHILSLRSSDTASAGASFALTPDQTKAVQAGTTEAANLTTLSRAHFDHDFTRALNGATGELHKDMVSGRKGYLSAMTSGKFDLKASVVQSAFESQSGNKVLVLVTVNGSRVVDKVTNPITTPQRFQLTMVKTDGKWLASDLLSVGVQ
jgi:Mce-associated membrane protein